MHFLVSFLYNRQGSDGDAFGVGLIIVLLSPKRKPHRTFGEKSGLMIVCALVDVEWATIWHDASGSKPGSEKSAKQR
jgi:hypothetical protein